MIEKTRLDLLLVKKGIFPTREKARNAIMAGIIFVNGHRADKPGQSYAEEILIEVKGKDCPFVSRGGMKLEKAVEVFNIDLKDKIALDIGASTGGFTDCMLQHGAKKVYAVDVGYGQIDWKLRNDGRVVTIERVNARYLTENEVPEHVDFISIDVSFISLTLILPVAKNFLSSDGKMVALIKPQFEAGRKDVGKGGVVKNIDIHTGVIKKIVEFSSNMGLNVECLDYSPIKGPSGNIEFLIYLALNSVSSAVDWDSKIKELVNEAHSHFSL